MSPVIITPPPVPPPVDPGSNAPPTLTITYYRQLAAHFLQVIDEIAVIIPRLQETVPQRISATPKPASGHRNIPLAFLGTTVDSVEKHPELQALNKLDVNRGRDTLQLIEAFRMIQDRAAAFVRDLEQVIDLRRSSLVLEALDTYAAARILARDNSNVVLSESVASMKRDLGRRSPRKKKTAPPSPTTPPETPEGAEKDTEPRGHAARV